MTDVWDATRYIAVATPSDFTNNEWKAKMGSRWQPPPPVYNDYALLKVLSMLRKPTAKTKYDVHAFQYEPPVTGLDFSKLESSDFIFIVGHGNMEGLYTMGPNSKDGMTRLIEILTKDGNLAAKRDGKEIVIVLLSCRAGLGLHKGLARKLFKAISIRTKVTGAVGFTFGSIRTSYLALDEVLLRGIPWHMEYPGSISESDAEAATSAREGKPITISGKQTEIANFITDKKDIEKDMRDLATKLTSTEVNAALDEIDTKHRSQWSAYLWAQFKLYATAKKKANLEFDMWEDKITDGYVWASSAKVSDAQTDAVLVGDVTPTDDGVTSIR